MSKGARKDEFVCKVKHLLIILGVLVCCSLVLLVSVFISIYNKQMMNMAPPQASYPMDGELHGDDCWVLPGRSTCAPQYIIAGAMKCGTTSMFAYLNKHPDVLPLQSYTLDPTDTSSTAVAEKEVRFFIEPNWSKLVSKYGQPGAVDMYLNLFDKIPPPDAPAGSVPAHLERNRGKITGEGTPMYICQSQAAKRVHDVLPYVKTIIMLRNPVDRCYSEFHFRRSLQIKTPHDVNRLAVPGYTIEQVFQFCVERDLDILERCGMLDWALEGSFTVVGYLRGTNCYRNMTRLLQGTSPSSPLCRKGGEFEGLCMDSQMKMNCPQSTGFFSAYVAQIYEWVNTFDSKNLLFIQSENFYSNTPDVMRQTQHFLGLSDFPWETITNKTYNIVNPLSKEVKDRGLSTVTSGRGLQVGVESDSDKYPPLNPFTRNYLMKRFRGYNIGLSRLLNTEVWWEE